MKGRRRHVREMRRREKAYDPVWKPMLVIVFGLLLSAAVTDLLGLPRVVSQAYALLNVPVFLYYYSRGIQIRNRLRDERIREAAGDEPRR
jgi:hypothetical protein